VLRGDQEIVVVVRREGRLLVMRRAPETSWHAAVRELREETGLEAQVRKLPISLSYSLLDDPPAIRARYAPGVERVTVHAFVADAPAGWEPTLDAEHDVYRWCELGEALDLMAYDTARDALRAGAAAP
jgi:8-oxo-dGTP pyrophosphatase MutT (NUDIX family)